MRPTKCKIMKIVFQKHNSCYKEFPKIWNSPSIHPSIWLEVWRVHTCYFRPLPYCCWWTDGGRRRRTLLFRISEESCLCLGLFIVSGKSPTICFFRWYGYIYRRQYVLILLSKQNQTICLLNTGKAPSLSFSFHGGNTKTPNLGRAKRGGWKMQTMLAGRGGWKLSAAADMLF